MKTEILMIGTELLIGQIQDTNASFLGQSLAENGLNLYQKTTVGDNLGRIVDAIEGALARADVVLCSGGLGPTEDDITREAVAKALGQPLEFDAELFDALCARFANAGVKITDNNRKQAMRPQGGRFIPNPYGTAPGILAEDDRGVVICMPGVPHELKHMMTDEVVPYLRDRAGIREILHYRVLKVCGMGESRVDSAMGDLVRDGENPTVGLLASPDAVRIRIAARAANIEEAEKLIAPIEAAVRERLPGAVMGRDEDTLESVVDTLMAERGWKLALWETTTGGALAQRLSTAGAECFVGAQVQPPQTLNAEESQEPAVDKARALLLEYPVQCALAMLPGPKDGQTVVSFVTPGGEYAWEVGFYGDTRRNAWRVSNICLEKMRRHLLGTA